MQTLLECDEATVVGYLDSVKLQFDVHDLVLVHGNARACSNCPSPREMYRFQRRNAFRVRPLDAHQRRWRACATRRCPRCELALRVLDVSIGGCALFLPDDVPPMDAGMLI